MPVYNGNVKQKDLYFGGVKIKEAFYGSTKVYSAGYPQGTVIFDSRTAGTHTITLKYKQKYQIWVVGGGGNGGSRQDYGGGAFQTGYAGGGSGAMISGTIIIDKGTYSLTIGGAVQDTTFLGQVAGHGNNCSLGYATGSPGTPGSYTITLSGLTGKTNNDATYGYYNTFWGSGGDTNGFGGSSPYNNQRNGPGAGGTANNSNYQKGGYTGYARIVAVQS